MYRICMRIRKRTMDKKDVFYEDGQSKSLGHDVFYRVNKI